MLTPRRKIGLPKRGKPTAKIEVTNPPMIQGQDIPFGKVLPGMCFMFKDGNNMWLAVSREEYHDVEKWEDTVAIEAIMFGVTKNKKVGYSRVWRHPPSLIVEQIEVRRQMVVNAKSFADESRSSAAAVERVGDADFGDEQDWRALDVGGLSLINLRSLLRQARRQGDTDMEDMLEDEFERRNVEPPSP